ncbi:MAG: TIM barrel protein [Methanomassiliicoccales archaeon]
MTMLYLGTAGYPRDSRSPLDALDWLSERGLNALELQFVRRARMGREKAESIGERARELGILLSAHAPYYINFNSNKGEVVERSVEWVMKTARIACDLGAYVVVIHAASYMGQPPERTTRSVIQGIRTCQHEMEKEGLEVTLGLETMGKRSAWGRMDEIERVMEEVDGVMPVLDFAHLHALEPLREEGDFRRVLDRCSRMYRGHLHCHFSCVEYGDRGERRHLPLDAREPDFSFLAPSLGRWESGVTVISETPPPEEGALEMRSLLADYQI